MQDNLKSLSNLNKANTKKRACIHCGKEATLANIGRHEKVCSRPKITKECPVCKNMHIKDGVTCSYSCSNTYFRSGHNNPNWSNNNYRHICFKYHGQKCIVCGEEKILAVHHINENHNDNRPENLVPLCPTHHQYVHSKYKKEVQPYIDKFLGVGESG